MYILYSLCEAEGSGICFSLFFTYRPWDSCPARFHGFCHSGCVCDARVCELFVKLNYLLRGNKCLVCRYRMIFPRRCVTKLLRTSWWLVMMLPILSSSLRMALVSRRLTISRLWRRDGSSFLILSFALLSGTTLSIRLAYKRTILVLKSCSAGSFAAYVMSLRKMSYMH